MKRLVAILIVIIVGYVGYRYYTQNQSLRLPSTVSSRIDMSGSAKFSEDKKNVLGEATTNFFSKGKELLNTATGGAAEPVINKAVSDLEKKVKDLPEEQYKKVKYEFCKDVIPSPGNRSVEESL